MISDISIQFCEYNRSNPDADRIYRPQGSGDYLFLLLGFLVLGFVCVLSGFCVVPFWLGVVFVCFVVVLVLWVLWVLG